jgi:hypothetical protein
MAKQGQHTNSVAGGSKPRGHEKSKGRNNPSKSQTITTGSYKKPETTRKQTFEHKDPHRPAQAAKGDWNEDIRDEPSIDGSTRARDSSIGSGRSGSRSNADAGSRGH